MRVKKTSENIKVLKLFFDPEQHSEELTFPRICKFIRETFKATQVEMAEKLGVTPTGYRYWETGISEPSSKTAFNLCLLYLQALEFTKIKHDVDKLDLLPQLDKNNPFNEVTSSISKTEEPSINAA